MEVRTLLSRLRFPPLTKATPEGSFGEGALGVSEEDMMVMRENSPFMPAGAEPGTLGEMATTWRPFVTERDMEDTQEWAGGRSGVRAQRIQVSCGRPSALCGRERTRRRASGAVSAAAEAAATDAQGTWERMRGRKGQGGMPAEAIRICADEDREPKEGTQAHGRTALDAQWVTPPAFLFL